MNYIKIDHLTKKYVHDHRELFALKDLSLDIPIDKNTVIIGKSGSGKSTLINIINGLISPTEGTMTLPSFLKTATMFQEARLLPWLTVKQNTLFWNPLANPETLLRELELTAFQDLYPYELSGGMAQKTALIRALLYEANFLLFDEPFSSLDYFTRIQLQQKLLHITSSRNLGMVFVTHNVDKAILLGDIIIILDKGHLKEIFLNDAPREEREDSPYSITLKKKIFQTINH